MPTLLRMSISLAALVLSLLLPERPSEIHRCTVEESVPQFHRSDLPGQCEIHPLITASNSAMLMWLESSLRSQLASSTMLPSISTAAPSAKELASTQTLASSPLATPKSSHRIILPNFSHDLIQKPPYFFIDDDFIPSL
ncbi:hypothetical protein GWK47_007420 [Chionoecetes opilio]|uniref:Uncharacterized protein n=1 Tax=Chionoecetes opilio TaxID=41210 RepID=A0A8J4Y216_CHIOP|nr:hypothetical protein GWK47_007420 [Chionoecetes opilio]